MQAQALFLFTRVLSFCLSLFLFVCLSFFSFLFFSVLFFHSVLVVSSHPFPLFKELAISSFDSYLMPVFACHNSNRSDLSPLVTADDSPSRKSIKMGDNSTAETDDRFCVDGLDCLGPRLTQIDHVAVLGAAVCPVLTFGEQSTH